MMRFLCCLSQYSLSTVFDCSFSVHKLCPSDSAVSNCTLCSALTDKTATAVLAQGSSLSV